jgi:hypothetical protein
MRSSSIAAVGLVFVAATAACTSASVTSHPSATSSASTAGSSASASAPLSPAGSISGNIAMTGQQYRTIAAGFNAALKALQAVPTNATDWQLQAALAKLAAAESREVDQLKAAHWPAFLQAAIGDLENTAAKESRVFRAVSMAAGIDAMTTLLGARSADLRGEGSCRAESAIVTRDPE